MAEDWAVGVDDVGMCVFFLTFGVNYAHVSHPRGEWIHPDGWVTVVGPSYEEARTVVVDLFGKDWSDLYDAAIFEPVDTVDPAVRYFPRGELLRIVVPAGVVETEDHRD